MTLEDRLLAAGLITGTFTLRSGATSSVYFDAFQVYGDALLLMDSARALANVIPHDCQMLAGIALGGVPLCTALSLLTGLPAVTMRDAPPKHHGRQRPIEGPEVAGKHVCIVEDVITTGGAVFAAARVLRATGATVDRVVCLILRDPSVLDRFDEEGLTVRALIHGLPSHTFTEPAHHAGRQL